MLFVGKTPLVLIVSLVLMQLHVEGAVPLQGVEDSTDAVIGEDSYEKIVELLPEQHGHAQTRMIQESHSTHEKQDEELDMVQEPGADESQEKARGSMLDRWEVVKREQMREAASVDTPTAPPTDAPVNSTAVIVPTSEPTSDPTSDMPCPPGSPCDTKNHYGSNWDPEKMKGWSNSYSAITAEKQCTNWLRHASVSCEVVTQQARRCTLKALAAHRLQGTVYNSKCMQVREACANNLQWCHYQPNSHQCADAHVPCQKIGPLCQHPVEKDTLAHCLPLQKTRMWKCGEGYAKAYSACWYAFNSIAKRGVPDQTAPDEEALEEDVAVHSCGSSFAKSTLLCSHESTYFNNQKSHHPEQAPALIQQRDSSCQDMHKQGQHECHSAWSQLSHHAHKRDQIANNLSHSNAQVFWPLQQLQTAHTNGATQPNRATQPAQQQATPYDSQVQQLPPQKDAYDMTSWGTVPNLGQLIKETHDIQAQISADSSIEESLLEESESSSDNPMVTLKPDAVHPSPFDSTRDLSDGMYNSQEAISAAETPAAIAKKVDAQKNRRAVLAAQTNLSPPVDPALKGAASYHQVHPLSVAMQTCRAKQHGAAVHCLDSGKRECHAIWQKAYMACFSTFSEAKSWLQRAGRLPAEHKVAKKEKEMALPIALQHSAQLTCAHSYAGFSAKCHDAHKQSGALCRDFSTREGALSAEAAAHCGTMNNQAQAVCSQAKTKGRSQCDAAWKNAKSVFLEQQHPQQQAAGEGPAASPAESQAALGNAPRRATAGSSESIEERLHQAQMATMARVEATAKKLQEVRRSGLVTKDKKNTEATVLLEMHALHGVESSLAATLSELHH